jgi:hypothetical protein
MKTDWSAPQAIPSSSGDMQWEETGLPAALLDPFNPLKSA